MALFYTKQLDNGATIWLWDISISDTALYSKNSRKREQEAVRCLLNTIFKKEVLLCHHENGCPYLENCDSNISISHTSSFAAVIIHPAFSVGVDIENLSRNFSAVEKKALSPEEIQNINPEKKNLSLAIYWSAKEAVFKRVSQSEIDFAKQIFIEKFDPGQFGNLNALFTDKQGNRYELFLGYEIVKNHILVWTAG